MRSARPKNIRWRDLENPIRYGQLNQTQRNRRTKPAMENCSAERHRAPPTIGRWIAEHEAAVGALAQAFQQARIQLGLEQPPIDGVPGIIGLGQELVVGVRPRSLSENG